MRSIQSHKNVAKQKKTLSSVCKHISPRYNHHFVYVHDQNQLICLQLQNNNKKQVNFAITQLKWEIITQEQNKNQFVTWHYEAHTFFTTKTKSTLWQRGTLSLINAVYTVCNCSCTTVISISILIAHRHS